MRRLVAMWSRFLAVVARPGVWQHVALLAALSQSTRLVICVLPRPDVADRRSVTKEYESSWIFEPYMTCANVLRRVQHPAFSLVLQRGGIWGASIWQASLTNRADDAAPPPQRVQTPGPHGGDPFRPGRQGITDSSRRWVRAQPGCVPRAWRKGCRGGCRPCGPTEPGAQRSLEPVKA
jgi:hypothetical protein